MEPDSDMMYERSYFKLFLGNTWAHNQRNGYEQAVS